MENQVNSLREYFTQAALLGEEAHKIMSPPCLLYTSDAADERSSVDLGGRRIIKKKKKSNREHDALMT